MKKNLAIILSIILLLSLAACGQTEAPYTNNDTQNEQKEENKQPENTEQNPGEEDKEKGEEKGEEKGPVPTDPVSKEVYDLKNNEDIVQALFSYKAGDFGVSTKGAVEIINSYLQLVFCIPKEGENSFDATVGFDAEDMSDYHFSFKLYLKEQGAENAEYRAINTNLVPWSIYLDPTLTIYRCPFYNSGLLDIVEVGKTYDTVIAVYENDKVVAWGESELTWYEDSQNFVEQAEQNESVIK